MSVPATSINSLPLELLSRILQEAACLNLQDTSTFNYGLNGTSEVGKDFRMQRVLRGHIVPDALRWRATESLRQVSRQWHDWVCLYALKDLYITRWRGSERWLQSRNLDTLQGTPSSMSVYRDPYHSLKQILRLFQGCPGLGACVHRLWFNGYNNAETVSMIFEILRHCPNLDHLTIPWTTVRYGTKEDWSQVLGTGAKERKPLSLEFLAVDLSTKKMSDPQNQHDELPLDFATVDFGRVKRLKVFGNTNFMPITNKDLIAIARSARNLKEIHITGTSSVTIDGVMALIEASHNKLRLLEHSPLSKDGFEHPDPTPANDQGHLCETLLACHQLRDLSISLPSLCEHLFSDTSVHWQGEVQIRAGSLCNHAKRSESETQARFWRILDLTRSLMAVKDCEGAEQQLDIQLFVNYWIFEPRRALVHGNIEMGQALSDGAWPRFYSASRKGPYGQTGLYGKDEGPYSCVSEEEFAEGLRRGYISF